MENQNPFVALLDAVADPKNTRADIVPLYRECISAWQAGTKFSWIEINSAISKRWSESGLVWIKEWAWEPFKRKPTKGKRRTSGKGPERASP